MPTAHFRDPELRGLGPERSFLISFCSNLAGTSVSALGRSLGGGKPAIIPDNQFRSSGARFAHFRANVEHPRPIFFQPKLHIYDQGTWEDPKNYWSARNCGFHFWASPSSSMLWLLLQCCQFPTLEPCSTHMGGHQKVVVGQ